MTETPSKLHHTTVNATTTVNARCNSSYKTFSFKSSRDEKIIKRREVKRKSMMIGLLLRNRLEWTNINVTWEITDLDFHAVYTSGMKSSTKSNNALKPLLMLARRHKIKSTKIYSTKKRNCNYSSNTKSNTMFSIKNLVINSFHNVQNPLNSRSYKWFWG